MLTGAQIRGARGLVGFSREQLAAAAGVSPETIKRLEGTAGALSANVQTIAAIEKALGEAGVLLIDENGQGPGVRLRKDQPA